jgi:hypothetical protein
MKFRIILILNTVILLGCNGSVTDFVKDATPPSSGQPSIDPGSAGGVTGFKITPGVFNGNTTNAAVRATVTTTDRLFQAGDVSVSLTINRKRGNPQ